MDACCFWCQDVSFVGELHHDGKKQRSCERDEKDPEIEEVERDEPTLEAVQENVSSSQYTPHVFTSQTKRCRFSSSIRYPID